MNVTVSTFNSNKYDLSGLTSTATMKAKLKLPDEVLEALCQNNMPRRWVINYQKSLKLNNLIANFLSKFLNK